MPSATHLLAFTLVSIGLVLTPGPNMIYLISRSLSQGRAAGLISLAGVGLGFAVYMVAAVFGLTALLFAVPHAYDALRFAGALYLLWLAWGAVRSGGRSPFQVARLAAHRPWRLFAMGLLTNLLNPKAAVLYLALLLQFVDPERGHVLGQSLILGAIQIAVSLTGNAVVVVTAGAIAAHLARRPIWAVTQRWLMGTVLAGLAARMLVDGHR